MTEICIAQVLWNR